MDLQISPVGLDWNICIAIALGATRKHLREGDSPQGCAAVEARKVAVVRMKLSSPDWKNMKECQVDEEDGDAASVLMGLIKSDGVTIEKRRFSCVSSPAFVTKPHLQSVPVRCNCLI